MPVRFRANEDLIAKDINTLVIYGTFIDAPTPYELRLRRRHACVVDVTKGKIVRLEPWHQAQPEFWFPENFNIRDSKRPLPQGVQRYILKDTQAVAVGLIDCVS